MAKEGDVVRIGSQLCLLFRNKEKNLCNVLLEGTYAGKIGGVDGEELKRKEAVFDLVEVIQLLRKRGGI